MRTMRHWAVISVAVLIFAECGWCFEDCFNYQHTRQDLLKGYGWDSVEAFEEKGKDSFALEKRWPTVNLELTREEEISRFGTTGLEQAQKAYLIRHYDGTTMRMFVFMRIVHAAGERNILGWRSELNPLMPNVLT
ncbi:MAG: hypothetical protein SV775_16645 [Thermodesulfobacteriota bacterium]|nr:hypothetical protein [Thermodesulfobacteriota bacterium]